jgi:hypothetical protein
MPTAAQLFKIWITTRSAVNSLVTLPHYVRSGDFVLALIEGSEGSKWVRICAAHFDAVGSDICGLPDLAFSSSESG